MPVPPGTTFDGIGSLFITQTNGMKEPDTDRTNKTDGQHGSNELYADTVWGELLGDACGLVFSHMEAKGKYDVCSDSCRHCH